MTAFVSAELVQEGRSLLQFIDRARLHEFLRSLPVGQFPALADIGEHVWAGSRNERFAASVRTLLSGIEAAQRPADR